MDDFLETDHLPHVINQRTLAALNFSQLDISAISESLDLGPEGLRAILSRPMPIANDMLVKVISASDISRDFVLFNKGQPLRKQGYALIPHHRHASQESMRKRVQLIILHSALSVSEIAKALSLPETIIKDWPRTGRINDADLNKLCSLEGIDVNWARDGYDSEGNEEQIIAAIQSWGKARTRQQMEDIAKAFESPNGNQESADGLVS